MTRQLVVVVHGVGVREAGTSTELLSAALQTDDLPPHSSDDFRLQEPGIYDHGGLVRTFPAHQRRYRQYGPDGSVLNERVIADFYWGDIAAVRWGAIGAVLAFFRIAMGLGHAIRENARDVFPGSSGWNYWTRRLAGLAVLAIHGPVVAMNIVLLVGILVAFLLSSWSEAGFGLIAEILLTASASAGIGLAMMRLTHTYLTRFLGRWVMASALLVVVLGFVHLAHVGPDRPDPLRIVEHMCAIFPETKAQNGADRASAMPASDPAPPGGAAPKDEEHPHHTREDCTEGFTGIHLIGLWLYVLMQVFILTCLAFIACIAGHSLWRYHKDSGRRRAIRDSSEALGPGERVRGVNVTDLVTPALGLMLLLWFVLISAVFGVIGYIDPGGLNQLVPNKEVVITTLRGLLPAVAGVAALVLFAGAIFIRKYFVFRSMANGGGFDPADYLPRRIHYAERYRLLVAKSMLVVPMVFVATLFLLYLHGFGWVPAGFSASLDAVLAKWTGTLLVVLAFLSIGLIVYLREAFIAGLGILTDVLAYLNDYSWAHNRLVVEQSVLAHEDATMSRAFAVHREGGDRLGFGDRLKVLFGLRLDPPRMGAPRGFWLRDRIQNRLRVFMATFLANETPDELVIISHSQGTVIVLDVLRSDGAAWRRQLGNLSLVTMGSPATHLYTHYFPTSFPDYATDPALQPRSAGGQVLDAWTNIFRVDDFVGTHVATDPNAAWPREIPVPANGHTNYWIDRNVMAMLGEVVQPAAGAAKSS